MATELCEGVYNASPPDFAVDLMNPKHRKLLLFAVLAGVAALAWFAPEPVDERASPRVAAVTPKSDATTGAVKGSSNKQAAQEANIVAELPRRDPLGKAKQDIFGFQTWQPPPPPPPKLAPAPPPPPPVPPPNPYRFAGRFLQDGQTQVFLTRGEYPVPIKVGDVLDGSYRIDAISGASIALTYVPLNYKEIIPIPTGNDSAPSTVFTPGPGFLGGPKPLVLSPP